ncbi:hypothetical protein D3C79_1008550 [compost metagenome]
MNLRLGAEFSYWQFRPYRRQASSHRYCTNFKASAVPVGAGLPAIGPEEPLESSGQTDQRSRSASERAFMIGLSK